MDYLAKLLPKYPQAEIEWKPVEAHPRLEEPEHRPYVDLIVRGHLFIKDTGGNELDFVQRVFKAHFDEQLSVEDVSVLVKCAVDVGADATAFKAALMDAKYEKAQFDANDYAYEHQNVWAVPTFICGDIRLDSVAGIGVTESQLDEFLAKSCK